MDPEAFNAFEAAGWNAKAAGYDELAGQITGRMVEPLLDAADIGSGLRVLDIATGPGYAAARAAARGARVVGVDVSEAMVALAKARYPELEFRVEEYRSGTGYELPVSVKLASGRKPDE